MQLRIYMLTIFFARARDLSFLMFHYKARSNCDPRFFWKKKIRFFNPIIFSVLFRQSEGN